MTQTELHNTILSAIRKEPAQIAAVVERVAEAPGVAPREARAAVERLVERGELKLDLDMCLEAAK